MHQTISEALFCQLTSQKDKQHLKFVHLMNNIKTKLSVTTMNDTRNMKGLPVFRYQDRERKTPLKQPLSINQIKKN